METFCDHVSPAVGSELCCYGSTYKSVVVYVGAACGQHICTLAQMYPDTMFILVDPNPFHPSLSLLETSQIKLVTNKWDASEARSWLQEDDLGVQISGGGVNTFFVSDIRSGDTKDVGTVDGDILVMKDEKTQEEILGVLVSSGANVVGAMMKFRAPYDCEAHSSVTRIKGSLWVQAFSPPSSSELRLVVVVRPLSGDDGIPTTMTISSQHIGDCMHHINSVLRPFHDHDMEQVRAIMGLLLFHNGHVPNSSKVHLFVNYLYSKLRLDFGSGTSLQLPR